MYLKDRSFYSFMSLFWMVFQSLEISWGFPAVSCLGKCIHAIMRIVFDVSAARREGHVAIFSHSLVHPTLLHLGGLHFWRAMLGRQPALARATEASGLRRRERRRWIVAEPRHLRVDPKACLELLALRCLDLMTHICKWQV